MKIIHLSSLKLCTKLIPLMVFLVFVTGCRQWAVDPEVRLGLTVLIIIISFITIFTKPIFGLYAVSVISVIFSPPVSIGFANLYFHQWVILIALLASIGSGLILGNFHSRIRSKLNVPMMVFVGSLLLSLSHAPNTITGIKSFLFIGVLIASYYLVLLCVTSEKQIKIFVKIFAFTLPENKNTCQVAGVKNMIPYFFNPFRRELLQDFTYNRHFLLHFFRHFISLPYSGH